MQTPRPVEWRGGRLRSGEGGVGGEAVDEALAGLGQLVVGGPHSAPGR